MGKTCDKCKNKKTDCYCVKKYTCKIFKELSTIEGQIQTLTNQESLFANTTLRLLSNIQTSINNLQCSTSVPQEIAFPGLAPQMTTNIVSSSIIQVGPNVTAISNPINVNAGNSVYVSIGYYNNINPITTPLFTVTDNLGNQYIPTPPSTSNISELSATITSQFYYFDNMMANNNLIVTVNSNITLSSIILSVVAIRETAMPSVQSTIGSNGKNGNVSINDQIPINLALVSIIGFGQLSPIVPLSTVSIINESNPINGLIAFTNTVQNIPVTLSASNTTKNLSYWTATTLNIGLIIPLVKPVTYTQTYTPSQNTPIIVQIPSSTNAVFITATGGGGAANNLCSAICYSGGGGGGTISAYQVNDLSQPITINQIGKGGGNTSSLNGTNTIITVDGITLIGYGGQAPTQDVNENFFGGNGGDVQIGPFITFGGLGGQINNPGNNGNAGPNAFGGGGGGSVANGGNSGSKTGDQPDIYLSCGGGGASALANGNSGVNGAGASTCSNQVNGADGVVIILFYVSS